MCEKSGINNGWLTRLATAYLTLFFTVTPIINSSTACTRFVIPTVFTHKAHWLTLTVACRYMQQPCLKHCLAYCFWFFTNIFNIWITASTFKYNNKNNQYSNNIYSDKIITFLYTNKILESIPEGAEVVVSVVVAAVVVVVGTSVLEFWD